MAELTAGRTGAAPRSAYLVRPENDIDAIRSTLTSRRLFAAYALAQLDANAVGLTRWWTAKGDGGRGLVLFASAGLGDAVFTMGDPDAVGAVLGLHQGPRFTYATLQPDHLPHLKRHFSLASDIVMSRMAVNADTFRPAEAPPEGRLVRLTERHVRTLNRLYSSEGSASYYNSVHLREGVYYGVVLGDDLVAVAGTHAVGHSEGIAVVGNVFTHPAHRGRGFARAATSVTTAALLRNCRDVVLTVDPANEPAVRAYRRLGYEHVCSLIEGPAVRKDPIGLGGFVRRRLAAWRGRQYDGEVVIVS